MPDQTIRIFRIAAGKVAEASFFGRITGLTATVTVGEKP
jgi:hypothetical protein